MRTSVVTRCDSAPILDLSEHVFDFVALFVEDGIVGDEGFTIFLWWNAGRDAALL